MSDNSKPSRPKLEGDRVQVTVVGYGASNARGVIDLEGGVVYRAPSWAPELVPPGHVATARRAARALLDKSEPNIQATQFTHGEVQFEITLDGQYLHVTFSDDGGGNMGGPLTTLSSLALRGPSHAPS